MAVWNSWAPGWAVVQLVFSVLQLATSRSPTEVEQTETAQPEAAAVQLSSVLAMPLISPYVHCMCLGRKKLALRSLCKSEPRGFYQDTVVRANNNDICGTDISLGLWVQIFSVSVM